MGRGLEFLNSLGVWKGKGDFKLEPLRQVLAVLGNPQDSFKTIHVAGTNGKGSTSTFIAAILGQAGKKVGLNISPHLVRINERIVIDGSPVPDSFFDKYGELLEDACKRVSTELSFHEAITALTFLGFREEGVDFGVIEVGLGGRLDASNVISRPEVSVIVSIGLDHEDVLGVGVENIAREKAGIIKKNQPVVTGSLPPEAQKVVAETARAQGARLYMLEKDFSTSTIGSKISLKGKHQSGNAAVAGKVGELLGVSDFEIKSGLESAFWPARLEGIEYSDKKVLIDCAHNPDGLLSLVNYLKGENIRDVILGFGALDTKNWKEMIETLIPYVGEWHVLEPQSDRAVPSETIVRYLSCLQISAASYGLDYIRYINYINKLDTNRLILLTGLIYLVGALRSLLDIPERPLWKRR